MKYVALLSGGKDSCYNLVHCFKNGHELVAAASLGPEPGKEELDSFLYQTVGQDAIELVAHALGVPLYRRVIGGSAVEQGTEYGTRKRNVKEAGGVYGDETEDLYELLALVKAAHPEIQGVSVGAILSNYQRVRVEHVCSRLGLTPLCYLWQRDQAELLSEMIEAGMEAVLIKVAGIGLLPKHLGRTLSQMQPLLMKLNNLYGSHVCGEGGEYESLTLDCPLFKQRIVLKGVETVVHSDNDFATVAYLRVKDAELQQKTSENDSNVIIPPLLDEHFLSVRDTLAEGMFVDNQGTEPQTGYSDIEPVSAHIGNWVSVCNVQRSLIKRDSEISLEDELSECFQVLSDHLKNYALEISDCTNINIFLSSIDLFARVNTIYGSYFGISPPSRACVAVGLPHPIRIRLDCMAFIEKKPSDRQALHVQGLSYWAPANIGPYSQAVIAGERISVSGQIGLMPSSLVLPSPSSLATEFALSCQHVVRVTKALQNGWEGITQSSIYYVDNLHNLNTVKVGHKLLKTQDSPTIFAVVRSLPKHALVEKQVLLHTGRRYIKDDEGEDSIESQGMIWKEEDLVGNRGSAHYEVIQFEDGSSPCATVFLQGTDMALFDLALRSSIPRREGILSARVFYLPSFSSCLHEISMICKFPITFVPCRRLSSHSRDDWSYAVHIIAN